MKKCIFKGREYRFYRQKDCPYLKRKTDSAGFSNLFCEITKDFCISNRVYSIPKNCPLEDV